MATFKIDEKGIEDSRSVDKRFRARFADAAFIVPWQIALPFWMIVGVVAILLEASTPRRIHSIVERHAPRNNT